MFNDRKILVLFSTLWLVSTSTWASDLIVKVPGPKPAQGQIGCALFENSPAFPMDNSSAKQIWLAAEVTGVTCKFNDLAPGIYAVSVGYDINGNKKVDTNFLGVPKEGWGVSNNVVPKLRAPTFSEAQFEVKAGLDTVLEIKLVY